MAASAEEITKLRNMLAEAIPPGGAESDTLFTNVRLDEIITECNGNLEAAAYEGWREKAGILAGMVDVVEGASSRELSKLHTQALNMVKVYQRSSGGPTEGRTRIGKVVRPI